MSAKRRRARKGRPRQPVPEALPDDLFDYADEPTPDGRERRRSPLRIVDVETLPVFDDWPEKVPITEEEMQMFEGISAMCSTTVRPQETDPTIRACRSYQDGNKKP